jgi:hypothetical protein
LTDLANPVIRRARSRPGDARGPAAPPAIELDTGMTGLGAYRSAKQWAEDIRSKKVSSVEALRLHLDRVEKFNQEVNAIVVFDLDRSHTATDDGQGCLGAATPPSAHSMEQVDKSRGPGGFAIRTACGKCLPKFRSK